MFAVFLVGEIFRRDQFPIDWRPLLALLIGLSVSVAWAIVQVIPGLPASLAHPIWAEVTADLPDAIPRISASPSATWTTIAQVVPAVLLVIMAYRLGSDRKPTLLRVIVGATAAVAIYGLAGQYFGFRQSFLVENTQYDSFLTGTFVGRNAAATYLVIGLICAAALIAATIEQTATASVRRWSGSRFLNALPRILPLLFLCLVLSVALLNTGSRGGILAGIVGAVAVVGLSMQPATGGARLLRLAVLTGFVIALLFVALSNEVILHRLDADLSISNRLAVFQDTVAMIKARPWLGHGAGAFADAFPLYHEAAAPNLVWNRAHNSYLQMAAELGVPVAAFVILVLLTTVGGMIAALSGRNAPKPLAVAAVAAALAVAVHALVDFSVQFQAVGLTLAILVASGLGELFGTAARRTRVSGITEGRTESALSPIGRARFNIAVPPASREAWASPDDPRIRPGLRVYVFGDLHGRHDLLLKLRDDVLADVAQAPIDSAIVIGLGDYVDRGPQSRQVIETLAADFFGFPAVYLLGNHEQMLLDFLDDPHRSGPPWLHAGAEETLRSYGVDDRYLQPANAAACLALRERFAAILPQHHVAFLKRLRPSFATDSYFFAHAGARAGVPLERQDLRDLLWIREGFADSDTAFEKIVVHGHTPVDQPYFGRHRINVDTGAYLTGRLTCLVLEGTQRRVLVVDGEPVQNRGSELVRLKA